MAISEESRHHLYQRLEQVLGAAEATVLMEHLPPVGWADVATKRDLDAFELRMNMQFDRYDERFSHMGDKFDHIDDKFAQVDRRFVEIDERLSRHEDRFDRLDVTLEKMRSEFRGDLRTTLVAMITTMVLFVGAVLAVVKL